MSIKNNGKTVKYKGPVPVSFTNYTARMGLKRTQCAIEAIAWWKNHGCPQEPEETEGLTSTSISKIPVAVFSVLETMDNGFPADAAWRLRIALGLWVQAQIKEATQ